MRKLTVLVVAVLLGAMLLSGCGQVQLIGLDGEVIGDENGSGADIAPNSFANDAVLIADALYPSEDGYARTAYFDDYYTIDGGMALAYDVYEDNPSAAAVPEPEEKEESGGGFGGVVSGILDSIKGALGLGEQAEAEVVPQGKFIAKIARLADERAYFVQAEKGNSWNRVRTEGTVAVVGGSVKDSKKIVETGGDREANKGEAEAFSEDSGISIIRPSDATPTETADKDAGTGSLTLTGTNWHYYHDWAPEPEGFDLSASRDSRENSIRLALAKDHKVTDLKWTGESSVVFQDSFGALRTRSFSGKYDGKDILYGAVYYTAANGNLYQFYLIETGAATEEKTKKATETTEEADGGTPKAIFDSAVLYSA